MNGALAYILGIGFKNIKPALYAWFFNALFSLAVYVGFYNVFYKAAGTSILAADVTGQIGLFTFFTDISVNHGGNLSLVLCTAIIMAFLYFGFSVFIAGGIYSTLIEDEKTTFTNLVASSIESFPNMVMVFLGNILVWFAALLGPAILLVLFSSFKSVLLNETLSTFLSYFLVGLAVFLFIVAAVIYDYARIFKLKYDTNLLQTFKYAIRFTFSNKLPLVVIFLSYGLSLSILYLIYLVSINLVEHLLYAILIYLTYQVFIFVRYFLKVVVMRAEIYLTESKEV
jgi:hypothetical protein